MGKMKAWRKPSGIKREPYQARRMKNVLMTIGNMPKYPTPLLCKLFDKAGIEYNKFDKNPEPVVDSTSENENGVVNETV
jgi:hypothetical protein